MQSLIFHYVNLALDVFGAVLILIIFGSCLEEHKSKKGGTKHFLFLLLFILLALASDILARICDGNFALRYVTMIANMLAMCASYCAIIAFMEYLKENLHEKNRAVDVIIVFLKILCVVAVSFLVGNVFFEYLFTVNEKGEYVRIEDPTMIVLYLLFPAIAFTFVILISLLAVRTPRANRISFIAYTIFPVAGAVVDYIIPELALTYIGFVISVLIIYTNIYLQKQRLIDSQRNALMISQINPHFMYNTLSTIASMCVIAPKQAQNLTVNFSSYLRQNLNTLTCEELIPFDEEIKHVECYLKIEKARFGDRLNVVYAIQSRDFFVPPLSVQPLVENAIKHGLTKKSEGGTIKISTYSTDRHYVIEIKDDGIGFDTEARQKNAEGHIGLENVKNRIVLLCKGDMTIKSTVGVGTRVTIEIPKKRGKKHEHIGS